MAFDFPTTPALAAVRIWLAARGREAAEAAALLGGTQAGRAVHALAGEIAGCAFLTRRHRLRLAALHDLVALETLPGTDDLPGALPIAPDDPRVPDLCLLADSLGALLAGLRAGSLRAAA